MTKLLHDRDMAPALQRTAVFVVRVWFEEGGDEGLWRARITRTLDASAPDGSETSAVASEQELLKAVRTWIRRVAAGR